MFLTLSFVLFFGCLLTSAALTPLAMRFARRVGAVDKGGYRKAYRGDIPLLGGLAIAIPLIGLCLAAGVAGHFIFRNWQWVWTHHRESFDFLYTLAGFRDANITLAVGGIAIVALGVVDDIKTLKARWKLLGQIFIAVFVCLSGNVLTTVTIPILGVVNLGPWVGGVLTMLWIVGLINAFNLIDGVDGLATGIALVGAMALIALGILQDTPLVAIAGVALAGSLTAFLLYNFPPAWVFLGDTGSMFLGYTLAMMSLIGAHKSEAAVIVIAPILALSFPLFETLLSIVRRYLRGVPVFAGDNRHTHHRLLRKGYSQPKVVLTLWGTGLCLASAGVLLASIPENSPWAWTPYALYVGTLVNIVWLAGYLRPANFKAMLERRNRNRIFQALRRYVRLRIAAGLQPMEMSMLLELCCHELGLNSMEIRIREGARLVAFPPMLAPGANQSDAQELLVKSSDGQDILLFCEFKVSPGHARLQDVFFCLAGIFDGLSINANVRAWDIGYGLAAEGTESNLVSFRPAEKRGARE